MPLNSLRRAVGFAKSSLCTKTLVELGDATHLSRADLEAMLQGRDLVPFKVKPHQPVYRVPAPSGGERYLKRTTRQSPRSVLRHLLRFRRAHVDCVWEYLAIKALIEHGFAVMKPIAFGEEQWLGAWPRRGFLLVDAAPGREVKDLWRDESTESERLEALRAVGRYLGEMHGAGFYHPARFHDFFYVRSAPGDAFELTMIDVDFRSLLPVAQPFDESRAVAALAQSAYLCLRGAKPTRRAAVLFLRAWQRGVEVRGGRLSSGWLDAFLRALDSRLRWHHSERALVRAYPTMPRNTRDALDPAG